MKKTISILLLCMLIFISCVTPAYADIPGLTGRASILMEQTTGEILFEANADEKLAPASLTKIMTMLLIMEALQRGEFKLDDIVTCSEYASSMGGSQIWLEPDEKMSVNDLLKATAIPSANDAAVALAEFVSGTETAFVALMNKRAKELKMTSTSFVNACGLDEDGHLSSARDVAIMSKALMKHDMIKDYSTVWMDTLRKDSEKPTELVNTNKLINKYDGLTGLKTGTTTLAGNCLAATAIRDNLSLIAVNMGSPTGDERFSSTRSLLDYGFMNYMMTTPPPVDAQLTPVKIIGGVQDSVNLFYNKQKNILIEKVSKEQLQSEIKVKENVKAPVEKNETLGSVTVTLNGKTICEYPLKAEQAVSEMNFFRALSFIFGSLIKMG